VGRFNHAAADRKLDPYPVAAQRIHVFVSDAR
jgi:hypothetical protein